MNSNTVVRAYRELEHEGIVELRQWPGCFYQFLGFGKGQGDATGTEHRMESAIERLHSLGVSGAGECEGCLRANFP